MRNRRTVSLLVCVTVAQWTIAWNAIIGLRLPRMLFLGRAEANCNLIAPAERMFPSTKGRVASPIAPPGWPVEVRLTGCDAPSGFKSPASANTVQFHFTPPSGAGETPVTLASLPNKLCSSTSRYAGAACTSDANCCDVASACPDSCIDSVEECAAGGQPCNVLRFAVPDTTGSHPPYGLAGPARIEIRETANLGNLLAQIDDLNQPTESCDLEPEAVFKKFTVLPPPNPVDEVCEPPCPGGRSYILLTVDGDNSLIIPLNYRNILPSDASGPTAAMIEASSSYPAFDTISCSDPSPVACAAGISDRLAARTDPSAYIRSFTIDGRPLPPLLRATNDGGMFGTADGNLGVIRVARSVEGSPDLFNLTDRLWLADGVPGKGPIKINPDYTIVRGPDVPLRGLRSSLSAVSFVSTTGRVQVMASASALNLDTNNAVARLETPAFTGYALETSGNVTAFLQSEAAQGTDVNGDGDTGDSILRVYKADTTDVSPSPLVGADILPVLSNRSLAVSDPLVFFRTRGNQLRALQEYAGFFPGVMVKGVTMSPDGKSVYVMDPDADSVSVYSLDPLTGVPLFVEVQTDGVASVDGLDAVIAGAVSPDGRHLYTASGVGAADNAVAVFGRAADTGALSFVEAEFDGVGGVDGLQQAQAIAVSPDGNHVYVTGLTDTALGGGPGALAAFSRNIVTGEIGFLQVLADGVGGVDGLLNAGSLAISGDGAHVYVCGQSDDAIAVFSRNSGTGLLTFVEVKKDGVGGVDGLNGCNSVTVSPDGKHVYAAGFMDDAVAVFSRNAGTGALTFVEVKLDGVGGVYGLENVRAVAVSPDGTRLYAHGQIGFGEGTLVAFERNESTGALTFLDEEEGGVGGVASFGKGLTISVSPDNARIYVPGIRLRVFDAVAALRVYNASISLFHPNAETDATSIAVAGNRALVLTPEANRNGTYLNGDGDTLDEVAQLYDGGSDSLTSLGRAAPIPTPPPVSVPPLTDRIAVSKNIAALLVCEVCDDGVDLNGDGDLADNLLAVWKSGDPVPIPTPFAGGGWAADAVQASDVCATGIRDGKGCEADADCTGGGSCSEAVVAFTTPEYSQGTVPAGLNGDGDVMDRVIQVYRESTGAVSNVGQAAVDFVLKGHVLAFRTPEAGQGVGGTVLNLDGDTADAVLQVYDLSTGKLINTRQAAELCTAAVPGCESIFSGPLYEVRGEVITFLTREADQGRDLTGDQDTADVVRQDFNLVTGKRTIFEIPSTGGTQGGASYQQKFSGRTVVYTEATEAALGRDVNDDGDITDTVVLVEGDEDEDGTYNQTDICVDGFNPTQTDSDIDGLGDGVCDATAYCDDFVPGTPLVTTATDARKCQEALGRGARVYMKMLGAATRTCLNKIAAGRLAGDATTMCRGAVVDGIVAPPQDTKTAEKIAKAEARLWAIIWGDCSDLLVDQLRACADTTSTAGQCLMAAYAGSAMFTTQQAYGALSAVGDPATRACQNALGAASTVYSHSVVKAMQGCLDRLNKGSISGDPQTLCLGRMTTGGVTSPTDPSTQLKIENAEAALRAKLTRTCSATELASLDACATDPNAAGDCLACTNWRYAVEAVKAGYGPN